MNGAIPYRPSSREGSGSSGLPFFSTGSAAKSRLPRTASSRTPRQVVVSPQKDEITMSRQEVHDSGQLPTPNSRRRRRGSGDFR